MTTKTTPYLNLDDTWLEIDISNRWRVGVATKNVNGVSVHLDDSAPAYAPGDEGTVLVTHDRPFAIDHLTAGDRLFVCTGRAGSKSSCTVLMS